ncbi:hypothetical protein V2I01_05840 [Micromonospora sp. BRA006-A]|nr:hypothetical protein [Micromonospora sp. BRA006-A]
MGDGTAELRIVCDAAHHPAAGAGTDRPGRSGGRWPGRYAAPWPVSGWRTPNWWTCPRRSGTCSPSGWPPPARRWAP